MGRRIWTDDEQRMPELKPNGTMAGIRVVAATERLFGKEGAVLADRELHVVMASAMISVSGVFLVSPVVSELSAPLLVSASRAGQIITVYTAPLVVLVLIMGFLADRLGRKPVLLFGLTTFGSAGAAIGLVTDFEAVLALRLLHGAGYAAIIPVTVTLIGDLYDEERETTAHRGCAAPASRSSGWPRRCSLARSY